MSENGHRSLERALDIMEFVAASTKKVRLSEIYNTLDIPKGSCFTLVKTLTARKYLNFDAEAAVYSLGVKALEIGDTYLTNRSVNTVIYDEIRTLSVRLNETVHLAVLDGSDIIYILKHDSTHSVRMNSSIGKRTPALTTAVGKALMSQFSDEEIRRRLKENPVPRLTEHTITDEALLLEQLREIRRTSIAFETEESTLGIQCVATPVRNKSGVVAAGLSVAIPVFRTEQYDRESLAALLLDCSANISLLLGTETIL